MSANTAMSSNDVTSTSESKRSSAESDGTTIERFLVALRIRPLTNEEIVRGELRVAHAVDNKMVVLVDPLDESGIMSRQKRRQERQYVYDVAFDGDSNQGRVYEITTEPLVDMVMNGFNATVFAYGATGAGKTYTMVGTDKEPGIMVRALNDLFRRVDDTSNDLDFRVTMSYLEIYNEMIRDLLNPSSGFLELREDTKQVQVVGLTKVSTNSTHEVIKLLTKGNRARTMESTAANQTSSRSHALLEVYVKQNRVGSASDQVRAGKLYMIDLAGSERASNTKNRGKRLVEGAHINRSLLALGNCINALADKGSKYVNYRDSKLTRLLKDALSGNCRTVMIAHISPAAAHFDESRNTLVYADRAKNIRNKIHPNVMDVSYHVAQYQTIIDELRREIHRLRAKINSSTSVDESDEQKVKNKSENRKGSSEQMKTLKEKLMKTFNEQMELRQHLMEIDTHVLALSIDFERQSMIVKQWEIKKLKMAAERTAKRTKGHVDDAEPSPVRRAWDELVFIQDEQQRYWEMRQEIERQFQDCQLRAVKAEEELPFRISNTEQQELLNLLCKVHELEIEKMEMHASTLIKDHEIRRKDMMLMQYDRQRNLSDEIISKQKAIIATLAHGDEGNHLECPPELQDLYNQYKVEMDEIPQGQSTALKSTVDKNSTVSLPSLDSRRSFPARRNNHPTSQTLPRLRKESRVLVRRLTNTTPIQRNKTQSSRSLEVTPPVSSSSTFSLPPIDNQETPSSPERSFKEGVRNINEVVARRTSIRTANRRNGEIVSNSRLRQHRGSSLSSNGTAAISRPNVTNGIGNKSVLHRRRVVPTQQNTNEMKEENKSDNRDFGFAYPKPPVYYPPTFGTSESSATTTIVDNMRVASLDDLKNEITTTSSPSSHIGNGGTPYNQLNGATHSTRRTAEESTFALTDESNRLQSAKASS